MDATATSHVPSAMPYRGGRGGYRGRWQRGGGYGYRGGGRGGFAAANFANGALPPPPKPEELSTTLCIKNLPDDADEALYDRLKTHFSVSFFFT